MPSTEITNQLLKDKYNLHKSREIEAAARQTRLHTGKKLPQDPLIRIQNYLDRLNSFIHPEEAQDKKESDKSARKLVMLKSRLYAKYIIKPNDIPESYWENQKRIIRERGQQGDLEDYVGWEEEKKGQAEVIIDEQRISLNRWVNYFASPDSSWIPDPLKYYALRSVLGMAEYDKEKKTFPQRSRGTINPFPQLNQEALTYVLDALNMKYQRKQVNLGYLEAEDQQQFERLLQKENFAALYAWAIGKVTPASQEQLAITTGEWVRYKQGSDHMPLVRSLRGHGTGWCTVGETTAKRQLQGGDFFVYYTFDREGKATIPRVAIRMEKGKGVVEVRGITDNQNLDPAVIAVADKKLKELPGGDSYKKKVVDMEKVTAIEHKMTAGEKLTKEDLTFLYEIDTKIEGFGWEEDPRLWDLRHQRDRAEDAAMLFGYDKENIAVKPSEIKPGVKVYIGPIEPGIFNLLSKFDIEEIFNTKRFRQWHERKVPLQAVSLSGKFKTEWYDKLSERFEGYPSWYRVELAEALCSNSLPNPQTLKTIRLAIDDLGFEDEEMKHVFPHSRNRWEEEELRGVTFEQICAKAKELGLMLCPPEVAFVLQPKISRSLWYKEKDWPWPIFLAMKPVIFHHEQVILSVRDEKLKEEAIGPIWNIPKLWEKYDEFIFALPNSETEV